MNISQLLQDYKDKVLTMTLQKKYNLSWYALTKILKKEGVYKKMNSLCTKNSSIEFIKENYFKMSNKDISKKLDISEDWLRVLAKQLKLPVKGSGWKYTPEIDNVDKTTQEFNYFLGWMAADGNVSKNFQSVSLSITDEEIIRKFQIIFPTAHVYHTLKIIGKDMYKFNIGSKDFAKYLNNIGITPNKSKTLDVPLTLWTSAFLRGFFEGDGHIRKTSLGSKYIRYSAGFVCASEKFVFALSSYLELNNILAKIKKENTYFRISINGKENVNKFYTLIYKNCDIWYLKRKKQIMDQLFSNE